MLETVIAHSDTILLALSMLGGWIWNKIRGDNTDSAREMLRSLARSLVHAEVGDLDDPEVESKLRALVTQRATAWLTSKKIGGGLATLLVGEVVEYAVAELRKLISSHTAVKVAMEKELGKLDAAAQRLLEALNAKPLVPPLDPGIVTLEIKPAGEL